MQRSRVALLTNTYKDQYHYWEAVDLTRKLLLTSVALLVRVRVRARARARVKGWG